MESFLPLRSLQGINNAATEQSPLVGILRTQLGLIRKSDPLTESQRGARSRLLSDRLAISDRSNFFSLLAEKLEVLQTQSSRLNGLHSRSNSELPDEHRNAKDAVRDLLTTAQEIFGFLERAVALQGEDFVSKIGLGLREMLMRGFPDIFLSSGEGSKLRLDSAQFREWVADLSDNTAEQFAAQGVAVAIDSFVSGLIGDNGKLTQRIFALERERVNIDHQLNQINSQAEVNREKLFSGFQQIAKSLSHANSQKRFRLNRLENPITESFYRFR